MLNFGLGMSLSNLQMHYNITEQNREHHLFASEPYTGQIWIYPTQRKHVRRGKHDTYSCPALILFHGDPCCLDKAHELTLGFNRTYIDEAEYAAMNPGTSWSEHHSLNSHQDMLHALIQNWGWTHGKMWLHWLWKCKVLVNRRRQNARDCRRNYS